MSGLKAQNFPEQVEEVFDRGPRAPKLSMLEPVPPKQTPPGLTSWVAPLPRPPWETHTPENYDVTLGRAILDTNRYGLSQVKDRILKFLAVVKT